MSKELDDLLAARRAARQKASEDDSRVATLLENMGMDFEGMKPRNEQGDAITISVGWLREVLESTFARKNGPF